MIYIGIDNGITGSVAAIHEDGRLHSYTKTPIFKCLNYTKTKSWITRVDAGKLSDFLGALPVETKCAIERPFINPKGFKATVSAVRAMEVTQTVLERLRIPYEWLDSREWQVHLLPRGVMGDELKMASDEICRRTFPRVTLKEPGDGDSLLIAEYLRRRNLGKGFAR